MKSFSTYNSGPVNCENPAEERFSDHSVHSRSSFEVGTDKREMADDSETTSTNPTPLFTAVKARDWATVVRTCRSDDSQAATWIVEHNMDGSVRWKLLPLHQACESKAPSEAVKALIEAYPAAVTLKDSGGDLPLHLGCREKASKAVIAALLAANADAATVADDEGRLPLHLACRQGAGVEIIDNLIVAHHRAAHTTDSYLLLPLHWACAQNAALEVVESLLRAFPEAVDAKDKWGRTPRSLANASTNSQKEEVIEALEKDPSYWTTTLIDEIDDLRVKLDRTTMSRKESSSKAGELEKKLAEVTNASANAANTFRSLKTELEDENTNLRNELNHLSSTNLSLEEKQKVLIHDNERLEQEIKFITKRLNEVSAIFRSMEEQRVELVKVTGNMEVHLQRAAELANNDL